jgi:energy-coupling factor transporter ATP-binding protein EcfA2
MSSTEKTPSDLVNLYGERQKRFQAESDRLGALSRTIGNLRGLSFGAFVVSVILVLIGQSPEISTVVAGVALAAFVGFVIWHGKVERLEQAAARSAEINADAVLRVSGRFRELPDDGASFAEPQHPFASDIDLFGHASLFQRLGVARTTFGQRTLADYLKSTSPPSTEVIERRQEAVRELAQNLELRQEFEALALGVIEHARSAAGDKRVLRRPADTASLLRWAESKPTLSEKRVFVVATRALPPLTIAAGVAYFYGFTPIPFLVLLILQLLVLGATRADATRAFTAVSKHEGAFLRYGAMLRLLESLDAKAPLLVEIRQRLSRTGETPSQLMARFERIVGYFDLRHNGLVHPFADLFLLYDNQCTLALERWQATAGKELRSWFEAIGEFEALSAFAAFLHDEPGVTFPKVDDAPAHFNATALAHPLLPAERRVANDASFDSPGEALLVTGSNMSGKSTMLRSMGLAVAMALAGAPVCAKRLSLSRLALRTSIRVSDSLEQGVSHFYAEVSKLKAALDGTKGELPVFFLLDEILHGTNSRERQIGARWVLAELIKHGAIGAISTHDTELCRLTPELMEKVRLVHFRETVEDGKMTFDYRLRQGPVSAGNALRVMRIVGLEVPLE